MTAERPTTFGLAVPKSDNHSPQSQSILETLYKTRSDSAWTLAQGNEEMDDHQSYPFRDCQEDIASNTSTDCLLNNGRTGRYDYILGTSENMQNRPLNSSVSKEHTAEKAATILNKPVAKGLQNPRKEAGGAIVDQEDLRGILRTVSNGPQIFT